MPVETGGLAYRIVLDDLASGSIEALIQKITDLRTAASGLGEGFGQIRQVGQQARETAGGVGELATQTKRSSAATKEAATAYDIEAKAIRAAAKEHENRLVAQRKEIELQKIGIESNAAAAQAARDHSAAIRQATQEDKAQVASFVRAHKQAQQQLADIRKQEIADVNAVAQADIAAHNLRLQAAQNFIKVNEAARQEELALLRKNIEARNELSRLEQPESRSGLSRERVAQEARSAAAEARVDEQQADTRQRLLREDIQNRSEASREKIQLLAEEGQAQAAQDVRNRERTNVALREDILARAEASRERIQLLAEEGRAQQVLLEKAAQDRTRRLREDIQRRSAADPNVQAAAIEQQSLAKVARLQALLKRGLLPKGELEAAKRQLAQLNGELSRTESSGNRISFTFRRLFGIFAAFTIVRKAVEGFQQLVRQSIAFNAQIEQSALSIAALVVATGDVRDATGRTVDASQAFNLAQREARKQMGLLRIDALRTAATFDDLALAFQTAVAPGQQVGFNLDQIRKFAVQISQAATAIGLPQQQLAEEIRSILQGTIQPRTTRIAAALGITNDDIRRARELGTLSEFLDKRFQSFSRAAEVGGNNLTVIVSRLKNVALLIGGAASAKLFDSLKLDLKDILDSLVDVRQEGKTPIVNPNAIAAVRGIFDGLNEALTVARGLRKELDLKDIAEVSRGIGNTFRVAAQILAPLIKGIVEGISAAVVALQPIVGLIDTLTQGLGAKFLSTLARALTFFFLISSTIKGITGSAVFILGTLRKTGAAILDIVASTIKFSERLLEARTRAVLMEGTMKKLKLLAKEIGAAVLTFGTIEIFSGGFRATKDFAKTLGIELDEMQTTFWEDFVLAGDGVARNLAQLFKDVFGENIISKRILATADRDSKKRLEEIAARQPKKAVEALPAASLADALDRLLPIIGAGSDGIKHQIGLVEELKDELLEVELIKRRTLQNIQAEGAAEQIVAQVTEARVKILKESKKLELDIAESKQKGINLLQQQNGIEARFKRLKDPIAPGFLLGEKDALPLARVKQAVLDLGVELQAQIQDERDLAKAQLEGNKVVEDRIKLQIDQRRTRLESALPGEFKDQAQEIVDIALERLRLAGSLLVEEEKQVALEAAKKKLAEDILKIAKAHVDTIAAKETEQLRKQNEELALRVVQEQRIRDARLSTLELVSNAPLREQLALNSNILQGLSEQKRISQELHAANVQALVDQRNNLDKDAGNFGTEEARIDKLITAEKQKQSLIEEDLNGKLKESISLLEELKNGASSFTGAISLGFRTAFAQFRAAAPDVFQTFLSVGTQALDGFVSIGREAFASIFDPNSNFSIREALGRLLLQIADTLIDSSLRNLLAQILGGGGAEIKLVTGAQAASVILNIAGETLKLNMILGAQSAAAILAGGSATSSVGSAFTKTLSTGPSFFRRGGQVPEPQYRARGGVSHHPGRPRGRDTVPLWAEPQEWVIRARSAQMYGDQTMDAINRGLVNPTTLRALASSTKARSAPVTTSEVAPIRRASGGSVPRAAPSGGEGRDRIVPAIAVDERTMNLLLTHGEGQLTRWLADRGFVRN